MANMAIEKTMENWEKVLLIGIGIAVGAVATFIITRPRPPTATYTVAKTYTNTEEWEFIKDGDGRVRGVKVKRNAKEN